MSLEYGTFKYGGVVYPLVSTTTNSLLQDADPALFYALDYFESVLRTHIGTRLVAQAAVISAPIDDAVAYKVPFDPHPYLVEEQFTFPLLAVFRLNESYNYRTVTWRHVTSTWGIVYVLPPLTGGQAEHILPILTTVPKVLDERIDQGFDPGYASGLKVWAAAGVEEIQLMDSQFGTYDGMGNLSFPFWSGTLQVKEKVKPLPGEDRFQVINPPASTPSAFPNLTGIDVEEDVVADTNLNNVVDFKTDS